MLLQYTKFYSFKYNVFKAKLIFLAAITPVFSVSIWCAFLILQKHPNMLIFFPSFCADVTITSQR